MLFPMSDCLAFYGFKEKQHYTLSDFDMLWGILKNLITMNFVKSEAKLICHVNNNTSKVLYIQRICIKHFRIKG